MARQTARLSRYNGPPGDDREYWLPRDRDDLDAAWDAYYAAHPEKDPNRSISPDGTGVPANAWDDIPF